MHGDPRYGGLLDASASSFLILSNLKIFLPFISIKIFQVSCMAAVAYIVSFPANFAMAALGDRIGRKNTMFILSAAGFVSTIR